MVVFADHIERFVPFSEVRCMTFLTFVIPPSMVLQPAGALAENCWRDYDIRRLLKRRMCNF